MTESNNNLKMGIRDGLPIGIGYLAISFAFGLMAAQMGLSVIEAVFISALNLTSAGQLAALPILAGGGTLAELVLAQLFINARYSLMSISLSQKFDKSVRTRDRFYLSLALTDEIFAVAVGKGQPLGRRYVRGLIVAPYIAWTLGTLLGAISGNLLPEVIVMALSISMYAMFVAILTPAAMSSRPVAICVIAAAALSALFYYAPVLNKVPQGFVIIGVALLVSVVCALLFPIKDAPDEHGEDSKTPTGVTEK